MSIANPYLARTKLRQERHEANRSHHPPRHSFDSTLHAKVRFALAALDVTIYSVGTALEAPSLRALLICVHPCPSVAVPTCPRSAPHLPQPSSLAARPPNTQSPRKQVPIRWLVP
jgi:hypothetical protein